eukprot:CAMPEP_0175085424 /NCGR_PEP_ID=MMETSP0052_2-20121109/28653_1 /TAXON_ID=51329 ORGANISM="Polytomella parva, Strain SAG 63-3" /NCGR_SAMPLE_ID=MMETSP0052_2 /ASSEMBLY_ACC=CAM_ASM_000194 /LENGTH=320 /DNA_ID=CAMNT_0016357429 /DNA_START=50 /DNA_END=1012 /DNA_ORIENTATION=-
MDDCEGGQRKIYNITKPKIPLECFVGGDIVGKYLEIEASGMSTVLKVPLEVIPQKQVRLVNVWEWTGYGLDEGGEAASWFSKYFGTPCRLMRYLGSETLALHPSLQLPSRDAIVVRQVDPEWAPKESEVCFSDGFPILLANQASHDDLVRRIANEAETKNFVIERFRPNIIVRGAQPWIEDSWGEFRIHPSQVLPSQSSAAPLGSSGHDYCTDVLLASVKPCSRCKIPTIDLVTGEEGDEPTDTLKTFRSGKALGWNLSQKSWTNCVFFGWNICLLDPIFPPRPHPLTDGSVREGEGRGGRKNGLPLVTVGSALTVTSFK